MNFISTRNEDLQLTLSDAIRAGLASDGGLFVPAYFPSIDLKAFDADLSYPDFAEKLLMSFFQGDALCEKLSTICHNTFTFRIPLKTLNDHTYILELFHGPTLSFKDVGARFLAECLNFASSQKKTTIMVATSGDTGSAVASAFHGKSNIQVIILYPKGQISERQAHQITCWDNNVIALAVNGTFDDCQRLVKSAFHDNWWLQHTHLSSANSINIGRLLPQMTYYAYISLQFYKKHGTQAGFIVPTGNLGNATAGYWAKAMGFPIREIALSTNANQVIPDYLQSGKYHPRTSIPTLANAMDVGNPSNFERLTYLFNTFDSFKKNIQAISVDDEVIKKTILDTYQKNHMIICPHTATACFARTQLPNEPWIVVATADPSKFDTVIEPIIHTSIPVAPQLQALLNKKTQTIEIQPSLKAIEEHVVNILR